MLGRKVAERLATVEPAELWSEELRALAAGCDLVVCNLECCVSERGRPTDLVPGKPFFFRAPPAAVGALHAMGVAAVGLANNHALDYGPEALADTLALLEEAGIAVAGAGDGPEAARRGTQVEASGIRLGLLSFSDHPRAYAARPGVHGIAHEPLRSHPPAWLVEEIERLRRECDVVLAFPHWGPNMSERPSRRQRALAANLVEAGADVVAGHSAHVFHGIDRVIGGLVIYDLGDALDDYAIDPDLRNDLGVLVLWRPQAEFALELVGLHVDYCFTELAAGADADWIAARLDRACGELGTAVERVAEQRFQLNTGP